MAKKRRNESTAVAGDTFAVPLEGGRFAVCRVLKVNDRTNTALEKISPSSPYGPEAREWENTTIERFFDTAVRWARDSVNGNPFYTKPDNPWRRCADILYAAKGYE